MARPVRSLRVLFPLVLLLGTGLFFGVRTLQSGEPEEPATEANTNADEDNTADEADEKPLPENPFPGRAAAPEIEGGVEWLNTSGPISMRDLRGKVVLLDFWTYCCINCIHVLPDLKYLEQKYDEELVVIGVHSAKFDNERETENIREAILRYEIEHPVVNDAEMKIWRKFGARAWPTLMLIDPEGKFIGYVSGEGNRELLDEVIGKVVEFHAARGTLDRTPIRFDLERNSADTTPLRYPGKILVDGASDRVYISDSNHNRIVIADRSGKLIDIIGDGQMGATDGDYAKARFDHPQGMALLGNTLYIADTENHLIRTVDLKAKTVSTLAGTGEQDRVRTQGGPLKTTALNSPWDLHIHDGTLFIAAAGPHQIWAHRLGSDRIGVYAGSGREDVTNGPLAASAFAQPSGFAADDKFLYVADSEGSSVRAVPFDTEANVTTIVGTSDLERGRSLFEFGDIDGVGDAARLQHVLGLALDQETRTLYVADTYNHKLKRIDLKKNEVKSWLGTGESGTKLDPLQLAEPSGLSLDSSTSPKTLYVTDTNNHRLLTVNTKTGEAKEFRIEGLTPPKKPEPKPTALDGEQDTVLDPQTVKLGDDGILSIDIDPKFAADYKLNAEGPRTFRVEVAGGNIPLPKSVTDGVGKAEIVDNRLRVQIPLDDTEGLLMLRLQLTFTYCRGGESGVCKFREAQFRIPLTINPEADSETVTVPLAMEK